MRFVDFLKSTVLLSAGAATALAAITTLAATSDSEARLVLLCVGWWAIAAVIGLVLDRRAQPSPAIARLLASARATTTLPEHRPTAILFNRLWPLLAFTIVAGGLAFLAPQISGIGAGFAIIWALSWRRQDAAVGAIEERDGAQFYIMRASPIGPMVLERAPGFKAAHPERMNGAAT